MNINVQTYVCTICARAMYTSFFQFDIHFEMLSAFEFIRITNFMLNGHEFIMWECITTCMVLSSVSSHLSSPSLDVFKELE